MGLDIGPQSGSTRSSNRPSKTTEFCLLTALYNMYNKLLIAISETSTEWQLTQWGQLTGTTEQAGLVMKVKGEELLPIMDVDGMNPSKDLVVHFHDSCGEGMTCFKMWSKCIWQVGFGGLKEGTRGSRFPMSQASLLFRLDGRFESRE